MRADARPLRLALLAVMGVATLVYLNSLANDFALDDVGVIENNEQVHGIEKLGEAITGPYWPGGTAERGLYRPLTQATYALNWELGDGDPFAFHAVNVLLHAAVSGLVLLLILRLGAPLPGALFGGLLFAVHPVHVEAVANVVGRAEVLTTLFFLVACLVYLRAVEAAPGGASGAGRVARPGWGAAAAIGVLYFLALTSKENGITLPGVLLLVHLYRQRRPAPAVREAAAAWRVYAGMAAAVVVYFVLRKVNIGVFLGTEAPAWFFGLGEHVRILTAIRVWPEYLRLMLVPVDLVPDYGPGVIVPQTTLLAPLVVLGVLTGVAALLVAVRAWRRAPLITGGIAWFAITVLPVTGILFPVGILLAERTLYLPSVGLALAAAPVAVWVVRRAEASSVRGRRLAVGALALLLVLAAGRTWSANPVWQDELSVLNHLLDRHPANYRAQWALANHLMEQGDTARALGHYEIAIRMVPGYFGLRGEYGEELFRMGRYDAAAAQFDTALQVIPENRLVRGYHVWSLLRAGRHRAAAASALEAERFHPTDPTFPHLRARALGRAGLYREAIAARTESLRRTTGGDRSQQWGHLAGLALLTGDTARAEVALDSARRAGASDAPRSVEALAGRIAERGPEGAIPLW